MKEDREASEQHGLLSSVYLPCSVQLGRCFQLCCFYDSRYKLWTLENKQTRKQLTQLCGASVNINARLHGPVKNTSSRVVHRSSVWLHPRHYAGELSATRSLFSDMFTLHGSVFAAVCEAGSAALWRGGLCSAMIEETQEINAGNEECVNKCQTRSDFPTDTVSCRLLLPCLNAFLIRFIIHRFISF